MKIAIHQPRASYYYGGGERVPLEQASYFAKLGNEVSLITTEVKNKSKFFLDFQKSNPQVKIVSFKPSDKLKNIYKKELGQSRYRADAESIEFGKMTKGFYLNNQFDIVATHYTVDSLYIPKNQYVILELHGCPAKKRVIDEKSINRADALVCVAQYVGNFWKEMYSIVRPIHLAYNGINNKFYHPKKLKKLYDVLYIGRLIKIKGIDNLLRAFKIVVKHFPYAKMVVIGNGPENNNLHILAKKLKINAHIDWRSLIRDDELLTLYNSSKICVFPSVAKEGVLTTMLEAASCGATIITTDSCGMPEFINHNKNGILVQPHNYRELSSAIEKLLRDDCLRSYMGKNAHIEINRYWMWEKRAKELIKIYKQCLKK